jgi:hypothetical protein
LEEKTWPAVRLLGDSTNINERGWLNAGLLEIDERLPSDDP